MSHASPPLHAPATAHDPRLDSSNVGPDTGLDLAALARGRLPLPRETTALAAELPALAAITVAASLAPGLAVALFPDAWHICWSGIGLPAIALGIALLGAPAVRAIHQAGGAFLRWPQVLHAVLAATSTLALWSLLTIPLIAVAALLGLPEPTLHLLVAGPIGVGALIGLLGLARSLPPSAVLPRTTRLATGVGMGIAAATAVAAVGTCGDPQSSLLPTDIPPLLLLGSLWGLAGVTTGLLLRRRGLGSLPGALFAWPLLLPLLSSRPAAAAPALPRRGPLGLRIDATLRRLAETIADADGTGGDCLDEAHALREELLRADARLAVADRILTSPELDDAAARGATSLAQAVDHLRHRRARAAAEIETVLDAVSELRVQVGVLTLSGEAAPVRQRLEGLRARIAALQEVELG